MKRLRIIVFLTAVMLTASCEKDRYSDPVDLSGAFSRFALIGNQLLALNDTDVSVFGVAAAADPVEQKYLVIDRPVDSLFETGGNLLALSKNGLKVYNITTPTNIPLTLSADAQLRDCDKLATSGSTLYAAIASNNVCNRGTNELRVISLQDPSKPALLATYPMTSPKALAAEGNNLFICDGNNLKYYDATNPKALVLKKTVPYAAREVAAGNGTVVAIGAGEIRQYDYSGGDLLLLSTILTEK